MTVHPSLNAAPGDVFQILDTHGRNGWTGAFVLAEEIKDWGIVGFVHMIEAHDKSARAYIRLKWDHVARVGEAVMVPEGTLS